ncbi:DUF6069 family protein [Actinoplanes sp. NPDC051513]|uniref:DUF6069 family protein n=1 Tax=Actinoplanes sp. NPDC051513 TaxID=3363908 RepID=UPI003793AF1A
MTTTTTNPTRTSYLFRDGVVALVTASVATVSVAAVGHAAGVSLDVDGAPIPILGFGTLTALFSVVGLVLAAVLGRTVRHARRAFVRTTVVLTALSLVPDLLVAAGPATRALLMLTHLVAAAIVIPAVARRLPA